MQKYALVTGGNRGIGLEICKQLVARGKPVLLTARSHESAAAAAHKLREHGSGKVDVQPFALEAGDPHSIKQLTSTLQESFDQKVDLLVGVERQPATGDTGVLSTLQAGRAGWQSVEETHLHLRSFHVHTLHAV